MRIGDWIFSFCVLLMALGLPAEAQERGKVYHIGYLGSGSRGFTEHHKVFRQRLRELGYIEGQNIEIEWSFSKGKGDQINKRAADLVGHNLDCIFITGTPAARAAKKATSRIPIVMMLVGDPVKRGIVTTLSQPGGNITGVTTLSLLLSGKRLELLREVVPGVTRFAFLRNASRRSTKPRLRETQKAARAMGVELQSLEVRPPFDLNGVFRDAVKGNAGGLIVQASGFRPGKHVDQIVALAAESRLPTIHTAPRFMTAGGFMYYGPDRRDHFRRGADYVDKILKGAKPGNLPVEQPRKFNFEINLKTAKQLGVAIPPEVLLQATKVIK